MMRRWPTELKKWLAAMCGAQVLSMRRPSRLAILLTALRMNYRPFRVQTIHKSFGFSVTLLVKRKMWSPVGPLSTPFKGRPFAWVRARTVMTPDSSALTSGVPVAVRDGVYSKLNTLLKFRQQKSR